MKNIEENSPMLKFGRDSDPKYLEDDNMVRSYYDEEHAHRMGWEGKIGGGMG